MSLYFNQGLFASVVAAVLVLAYIGINIWYGARLMFKKGAFNKHMAWINDHNNIWLVAWAALLLGIIIGSSSTTYIGIEAAEYIFFVLAWPYVVFIMLPSMLTYKRKDAN